MAIFNSYVKLPEGKSHLVGVNSPSNIAGNSRNPDDPLAWFQTRHQISWQSLLDPPRQQQLVRHFAGPVWGPRYFMQKPNHFVGYGVR
jgi:hypothetical protein